MRIAVALIPLTALALSGCGPAASPTPPTPSVAVTTAKAARGGLPAIVSGYGTVSPTLDGAQTLSSAQPGQVVGLTTTPGAAVQAGQALLTFAVAPTARGTYQQAITALATAQKQRANTAQLLAQQLATTDQLAQADKAVTDARVVLDALGAEGASQAVRTFVAPFDGVVTAIPVALGDRTAAGAPLVTVARNDGLVVTVGIDPALRSGVAAGQSASLTRLSGGQALTGRVVRADSALNPRTRLVDVDIAFPTGALLPGEALQAAISTNTMSGWIVPHAAVVTATAPTRIFQVAGGKAHAVPVRLLLSSDAGDVVEGAVDAASPVIVDGAYQVSDGDAVRRGQ
ncbi:efflux RND transporter periplasmic adaptor subunit [Caulobacter sp. RHG1]|uniref:efflux RND transporter periplasmic adaptor subunit n=1 Tax=Caulobacter sp. (strain RHG1) TaxID=2545762 RepID=UPI00155489D0|nr:efflux RND transporter periplasmic adaptor subunit [Caulobacter sp. RHG1]NQE61701.1 hypothetical protein [Caulobacter sp. RHG1]